MLCYTGTITSVPLNMACLTFNLNVYIYIGQYMLLQIERGPSSESTDSRYSSMINITLIIIPNQIQIFIKFFPYFCSLPSNFSSLQWQLPERSNWSTTPHSSQHWHLRLQTSIKKLVSILALPSHMVTVKCWQLIVFLYLMLIWCQIV